jgi:hypothetical protein
MDETSRLKYRTAVYMYNSRKHQEESIILTRKFSELFDEKWDDFHEILTPIQSEIFMFMELGFTTDWIKEHMEFSGHSIMVHLANIRKKLRGYLGGKYEEEEEAETVRYSADSEVGGDYEPQYL